MDEEDDAKGSGGAGSGWRIRIGGALSSGEEVLLDAEGGGAVEGGGRWVMMRSSMVS